MNINHKIIDSSSEENEPINEYFDSSDEENDFHYTIITGAKFHTWEEFEVYLERYALQEGFSFKKIRVEYYLHQKEMKGLTVDQKKLHVKRRTYECTHSGNYVSKKIINFDNQRNRRSYQINCPWHVNATKPKKENTIGITSVKLEHNHVMNPLIAEMAPKFRKFTPEMITDVEFYVKHNIFSATQIYPLLRAKYSDYPILKKDLYNIIQKVKVGQKEVVKNDIGINRYDMVLYLFLVVDNNIRSRLIASVLLEDETENSFIWVLQQLKKFQHNLCIFHIDLNLKKNVKPKLGLQKFSEFRAEFFSCRNSLVYEIFESKWKILIEKYPEISKYLKRMLEPTKES
ncbi:hypothetical protein GLOIN_2v1775064 [Rhizophagus irregularis DAOM 181602=DAOM 197198]|uniref:Uncharacterized protein n=1 Tax=Rhizophagus irregularis (strain DAOM 181602 / DAOM 197198 / MUCL 43194) TaxID=747089 RepID=A0A2P4Q0I6_RHIID|nr:hypothetical protein GLOIN_2v1775064 [Rhizophagus irregularis DAOM 181602=DAOM 197198]POG71153.1 hypothetical protein GLOIN_2v1775064 [Rhizophagus irregularis DAOM 181602=DAOM 197198]|eukprot:XP_025178019.1 hypothetical protein GLOIN_2v1775064 [Rhizophagus irregularis DAOM 181602=DAOM 197198]